MHPFFFFALFVLTLGQMTQAQTASARATFEKPLQTFKLTLKNTEKVTATVVAVGVKSEVLSGSFTCMAADARAGALNVLANYLVPFHVATPETMREAEPHIELPPGAQARVAISISPSAVGACGPWSVRVAPVIQLQNGDKIVGNAEFLTSAEYAENSAPELAESELLKALKHLDPGIRAAAIQRLADSSLRDEDKAHILQSKLDDKYAEVRTTAAATAARLKHKSLAPKIAALLAKITESKEASAYCWALSRLRDPATIDVLVATFANLNIEKPRLPYLAAEYNFSAKDALLKFEHPDVPAKLRPLLKRQAAWRQAGATEAQLARFNDLCVLLTAYRDVGSAAELNQALTETPHELLLGNVLRQLLSSDAGPFLVALNPALASGLKHQDWNHRYLALRLLLATQPEPAETERLLRQGLRDAHAKVSADAAELTAALRVKALIPILREIAAQRTEANEKKPYCEALAKLGEACP